MDVGCGSGIFLNNSKNLKFDPMGIEPSAIACELCKEQYGFAPILGYLNVNTKLPHKYGVLTSWDVIEHVANPREFIHTCREHMVKNGILLLETPDESSLLRKCINLVSRLVPINLKLSSYVYYPSHRYYFTRDSITLLLKDMGFDDIEIFKEHTIFFKSIAKLRLYRKYSFMKILMFKFAFSLIRVPLFWNKQIVICRKVQNI